MALLLPAAQGEIVGDSTRSAQTARRKPPAPEGPTLTRLMIHADGTATFEGRGAPATRVVVTSNGRGLAEAIGDAAGAWVAHTRRGPIVGDHTLTIATGPVGQPAGQDGIILGPGVRISIPRGFAGTLMVGDEAGTDGARARAERLAEAASGQFDRIVPRPPETRFAEVHDPGRKTDVPTDQATGLRAILWRWLEQAQQSYQSIVIRQLERPAEPSRTAQSAPADQATEQALRQADADRRAAEARRLGDDPAKGAPAARIDTAAATGQEHRAQDINRLEGQRVANVRAVEDKREQDRVAAEKTAQAAREAERKVAEEVQLIRQRAAETQKAADEAVRAERARTAEEQRISNARAAEDKRAADKREQDRIAAEKAEATVRQTEQRRLAELKAAQAARETEIRAVEEVRRAVDARAAEDKRAADKRELDRIAAEKAAAAVREAEQRRLAELKAAQVAREAESRAAEETRRTVERQKAAAETAARVEQARKAEEQRRAEAARVEQLRLAETRAAEERRKAEQAAMLVKERERADAARLAAAQEAAKREAAKTEAARKEATKESAARVTLSEPQKRSGQPAAQPPIDRAPVTAARSQRRDTLQRPADVQKPGRMALGARRPGGPPAVSQRARERAPARWAAGGDPYRMSLGYSVSTLGYRVDRYTRTRMIPEIKAFFRCIRKRMGAV